MFLPAIDCVGDYRFGSFPEQVLFGQTADLHRDRGAAHALDDPVIEEGHPPFDGMGHLHAIPEQCEDIGGKHALSPNKERFIQGISSLKHCRHIELIQEQARAVAPGKLGLEVLSQQLQTPLALSGENF